MIRKVNLMMSMSRKRGENGVKKSKAMKKKTGKRTISIFYAGVAD